jgi:hypothetical protein
VTGSTPRSGSRGASARLQWTSTQLISPAHMLHQHAAPVPGRRGPSDHWRGITLTQGDGKSLLDSGRAAASSAQPGALHNAGLCPPDNVRARASGCMIVNIRLVARVPPLRRCRHRNLPPCTRAARSEVAHQSTCEGAARSCSRMAPHLHIYFPGHQPDRLC